MSGSGRDGWETITTVFDPVRAQLIADVLRQEGIEAVASGATGGGGVMIGAAVGALAIPIRVQRADVEDARRIIDAMDNYDAVFPDGDEGLPVAPEELERRHELLEADAGGDGPFRAGPLVMEPDAEVRQKPIVVVGTVLVLGSFAVAVLLALLSAL